MVLGRTNMNPVAVARVLLVFGTIGYQLIYQEKPVTAGGPGYSQSPGLTTSPIKDVSVSLTRGTSQYYHHDESWRLYYASNR